ncbi:uncharacterized protein [Manis javanica]|uniref:uncharacterized protein isoform X2 n=1 Tax=Manis javanica TaxID=9974 RepID=UPI003C6D44D8
MPAAPKTPGSHTPQPAPRAPPGGARAAPDSPSSGPDVGGLLAAAEAGRRVRPPGLPAVAEDAAGRGRPTQVEAAPSRGPAPRHLGKAPILGAPSAPSHGLVRPFRFIRRFSVPQPRGRTRPAPSPWAARDSARPGRCPSGRDGGGAAAARGGGGARAEGVRARPSVGPKPLKLQKCAGDGPSAANNQTQSSERKSGYGPAENGASASGRASFPPLPLPSSISLSPSALRASAPPTSVLAASLPVTFLMDSLLSLLFLLSCPLSVPLSPFCVTGVFPLSSVSGLALPRPSHFICYFLRVPGSWGWSGR